MKRLFTERQLLAISNVAEAGIGKSHLLDEFQAWTDHRPATVYYFRGRATRQTQVEPFGPLRDIVARWFELSDDDTLAEAKAKIEQGIRRLGGRTCTFPTIVKSYAALLAAFLYDTDEQPACTKQINAPVGTMTERASLRPVEA